VGPASKTFLSLTLSHYGAGDRSLAPEIFESLWPILKRFCARWLNGHAEAEDCAQRAIARVFAQAPFFDEERDAVTWALELAMWECRTARKQLQRARIVADSDAMTSSTLSAGGAQDPEQMLYQAELDDALGAAMNELSAVDRAELSRLLTEEPAGNAVARKRRQRAVARLKTLWRKLHDIV
jgi:RNA polymerase sigma factor (sigma-70 family)